jgi:predicted transcriptional regulator
MSADNSPSDDEDAPEGTQSDGDGEDAGPAVRERLEREADRALEQFDEGIVDLLAWILDTETRARIYIHLQQEPDSTSDEIAEGTGLYPSTVREELAELHEEGRVTRSKRQNDGAGNNPYEYSAMAPSELVADMVEEVQGQLNTVFNLDRYLDNEDTEEDAEDDDEPVTITVNEEGDE